MSLFLTLLPVILGFAAFLGAFLYQLHMFQLNSYHTDVHFKWMIKNIGFLSVFFLLFSMGAAVVVVF